MRILESNKIREEARSLSDGTRVIVVLGSWKMLVPNCGTVYRG